MNASAVLVGCGALVFVPDSNPRRRAGNGEFTWSKVSFQGIADMFRLQWIRRTIVSWDWLKLSQKWSFCDTSDWIATP